MKGHLSTECWSNPKNQSGSGRTQNKGGKGKPKHGTGKGGSQLLRAFQTWRQLKLLSDHRTQITKVGRDGHTTQVRRFRHFRWMQGLARKRRRMTVATKK